MASQIDHIRPPQYRLIGNKVTCRAARRAVLARMRGIESGKLVIKDTWGQENMGRRRDDFPLSATVTVHDPRFYPAMLLRGSIGAGEAYILGWWDADDLVDVIRILVKNLAALEKVDQGLTKLSSPLFRLYHGLRKNTVSGGSRNIRAHYDLSNEFYSLFLDPTMTYSCAVFQHPDDSLEAAQINKYERICQKLALKEGDRVLEIGAGWGGFAVHAARNFGCRVTTTTISPAQLEYARRHIRKNGLEGKVTLINKDYRELKGKFDKIVSIEMVEAVGHHFLEQFLAACGSLLKEDGRMCLQAITVPDHIYPVHIRTVDFIKRYIFPGSFIPSVAALCQAASVASDLRLVHLEDITGHYAKTLAMWRKNFLANHERILSMGFSPAFTRMWEFYLCYCQGSFAQRYNGDVQMVFARPGAAEPLVSKEFVPHSLHC